MRIIQNPVKISPINSAAKASRTNTASNPFDSIFQEKISSYKPVKFSKHATMRLNSRNIKLNNEQMIKLEKGIEKAEIKGINDSLILIDQIALVVNVKNRTVVTAMDSNQTEDRIFTN